MSNTAMITPALPKILAKSPGHQDLLSKEEETALAKKAESGDKNARDVLISRNLRLVSSIAWRKYGQISNGRGTGSISFDDLVQAGSIGLITAVDKYDWRKGMRLSTYATYWITDAINSLLAQSSNAVHIPKHRLELVLATRRAIETISENLGRQPNIEEMVEYFNGDLTEAVLKEAIELATDISTPISLDATPQTDGDGGKAGKGSRSENGTPLMGTYAAPREDEPEVAYEAANTTRTVREAIRQLPEKEQIVVASIYGIGGRPPAKLDDIATALFRCGYTNKQGQQLSKVAVFGIKERALKSLRSILEKAV